MLVICVCEILKLLIDRPTHCWLWYYYGNYHYCVYFLNSPIPPAIPLKIMSECMWADKSFMHLHVIYKIMIFFFLMLNHDLT